MVKYVKLNDGSIKIPILVREQPRLGAFRVYEQDGVKDVLWAVGPGQDFIYLPISQSIKSYIFIVRMLDSSHSDWRFFENDSNFIIEKNEIILPAFKEMEKLTDNEMKDYFLNLFSDAEKKYRSLRNAEK
jgi:hypothetical protein